MVYAFLTMSLKIIDLFAVYLFGPPLLDLSILVDVVPFVIDCVAQLAFEIILYKRGSSCWPLVPI